MTDVSPFLLANLHNGEWLEAQEFPELQYAVPAIIPEGLTVLAGAPKVGKSWFGLHIGLSVSSGRTVLGCLQLGAARPTLYLALEDSPRRLQARARSLLPPDASFPSAFDFLTEVDLNLGVATVAEWLERTSHANPLVIIDTLAKVMPRARTGESAYERDYRGLSEFKKLADDAPGTALVVVHHTRKMAADDFVDGVSGTAGITGSADTTVVLARSRTDSGGVLRVTGRDVWEAEYAVTKKDGGLWVLDGGSLEDAQKAVVLGRLKDGLGERSQEIIDLVSKSATGIGPKAIADKLTMSANEVSVYLGRLVDAGRVVKLKRGVYGGADHQPNAPNAPNRGGLTVVPDPDDEDL